ncbi:MAG: hypothetical protein KIT49_13135 [Nitrospira sp.]|nr:hypothetical protein [Nitrospira sp.]
MKRALVPEVNFVHCSKRANLYIRRALTQHAFDSDAITRLNLVAESSLGGLVFI